MKNIVSNVENSNIGSQDAGCSRSTSYEPIAIVGIGCRFPGGANSPDEFWDNLQQGKNCITETPESRWKSDNFFSKVKELRLKYSSFFEKYGKYGLFLFVWFPFWMTGPVVGSIIGFLIGITHLHTMLIVITGICCCYY